MNISTGRTFVNELSCGKWVRLVPELRGIKSVIPARPESFRIKEGFPTDPRQGEDKSGNDNRIRKNLFISDAEL